MRLGAGVVLIALSACKQPLPDDCARRGPLKIVPIGKPQDIDLGAWAQQYGERHGLVVSLNPVLEPPPGALDVSRQQSAAEELIAAIETAQRHSGEPDALIGITSADIFTRAQPGWRWAFGNWQGRTAVISTWRMKDDNGRLNAYRLSKMFGRYLGMLYCGFERSGPPTSMMRKDPILSVDDLDETSEANWRH